MSINPFTGRNPGYIFVDVPNLDAYESAMQRLPGCIVRERAIRVNAAGERKTVRSAGVEARIRSYNRWKGCDLKGVLAGTSDSGPGINNGFQGGTFAFNRWSRGEDEASHRWESPAKENRRLYVGSLPRLEPQSAAQDIISNNIFKNFEVEAISKMTSPHQSIYKKFCNHYYAFVDLPTAAEAQAAVRALDGMRTYWGFMRVKVAKPNAAPKVVREQKLQSIAAV